MRQQQQKGVNNAHCCVTTLVRTRTAFFMHLSRRRLMERNLGQHMAAALLVLVSKTETHHLAFPFVYTRYDARLTGKFGLLSTWCRLGRQTSTSSIVLIDVGFTKGMVDLYKNLSRELRQYFPLDYIYKTSTMSMFLSRFEIVLNRNTCHVSVNGNVKRVVF